MSQQQVPDVKKLNDELLKKDCETSDKPKRNTKEYLIEKIQEVAEENNLELSVSNTKLRRMGKDKLQQLLGELCEEAIKGQMAHAVGATGRNESVIALATLRMLHDLFANSVEQGLNVFLPKYGYELDGFSQSLKDPITSKCVDDCLTEIAAESDVLQYIQSPWARLGIAWSGGMMRAIRRARPKNNERTINSNAAFVGPRTARPQNPVRFGAGGGQTPREIHRGSGPPKSHVVEV